MHNSSVCVHTNHRVSPDPLHQLLSKLAILELYRTNLALLFILQSKKITLPNTDYAHKNITSNFSQALTTLPEDGSQGIRNTSEFLSVF